MQKSRMVPMVCAYGLIGVFFASERRLRQGQPAQSLDADTADHNSTRVVSGAVLFSLAGVVFAPPLNIVQQQRIRLPVGVQWLGVGMMVGGIGLRTIMPTPRLARGTPARCG